MTQDALIPPAILGDACISDDELYRYWLTRSWASHSGQEAVFVLLNPSKANALVNDPTVTRCIGFARAWGYDRLRILNLFAFRATDPKELAAAADPIGPLCLTYLEDGLLNAGVVIAGWGAHKRAAARALDIPPLATRPLMALAINADGSPKHPLYVRADTVPVPYRIERLP